MQQALYGPGGFYARGERPAAHFRTSVHASHRFAMALARLIAEVDTALGHPARFDLVDVGAGSGELLAEILSVTNLGGRLRPVAVEVAPRPAGLSGAIEWCSAPPEDITGLVVANEWLDNVPVDVVELTDEGPRLVVVDPRTGAEIPGPAPAVEDTEWLERWWPLREPGDRAEIGRHRCAAWASVLRRLRGGLALAVDYAHERDHRPAYGTLTGYRDGRCVTPVPDGSCDITAHVALDACAEAGRLAGATSTLLTTQRAALRALGLRGARPALDLARSDPRAYLRALRAAGEDAELIDPSGLGSFGWLVQTVGVGLPAILTETRPSP
ncbi:SAM-dependent methyltransferase [Actinoallomurus spadix]|uniref:SAM-dependent methyltransferase n=2 Tax=Actinoallomurus spadix TaxID=79912 RepID=A0ABP3G3Y7_9ACTN|nr:SAM-dependent methyltransferase [Actinoallomurus spadix]